MSEEEVLKRQNAVTAMMEQGLGGSCISLVSVVGGQVAKSNDALGGGTDEEPSLGGSCISLVSVVERLR